MLLMWVLGAVVLGGFVVAILWGGEEVRPPWSQQEPAKDLPEALTRFAWYLNVGVGAGIVSGLVMAGAGGRIAMRLLAATAGDAAQGRVTEAEEIVGSISLDGTLGLVIFIGLAVGLAAGPAFLLLNRYLPGGRWKGLAFAAAALILASTRFDPLRPDNKDFDIVGPGWFAVVVFAALAVGQGMLLAALAGRFSKRVPLISSEFRVLVMYAPLLIFVPGFVLLMFVAAAVLLTVALHHLPRVRQLFRNPKSVMWVRCLGLLVMAIAAPGFISAIADISGRP